MPKKYIFYSIGFLLLVITGIYGFTKWSEAREKVNLWTLVPDDAVFVVESTRHSRLLENLEKINLWDNIATLQSVEAFTENMLLLDSVSGRKEGASRFLRRKTLLTSVHVVNRNQFDFVFYLPINTVGEHRFIRTLVENVGKSELFTSRTYTYQGHGVTQIKNKGNGDAFTFFSFHNNIIVSVNPELIREIIRKVNRGKLESPAAEYAAINYLSQPEIYAHVFVNYRHLPQFLNLFLQDKVMPDIRYYASLVRTSMLGFKQQEGEFVVNGFSNPEPLSDSFYNRIKGQAAQPFSLRRYLPNRTALLVYLGLNQVSAARRWYPEDQRLSWPATQLSWADSLAQSYRQELGLAYLQANQTSRGTEKIVFARSPQPARTRQLLGGLLRQLRADQGGKAEEGRFGDYTWQQVPVKELPLLLFGSQARGFETCYVSQVDSFTVFAPDLHALRDVLADIRAGRVWSKSESQIALLEHSQQESNLSFYLNTRLAWKMLAANMRPGKRAGLLRHETLLQKLSLGALQYGLRQGQYYTSLVLRYPQGGEVSQQPAEAFEVQQQVSLPDELIGRPWLVPAPGRELADLLVQDEEYRLYRLLANGEVAWADSIEQAITSPIYPLSFGADKQHKYLFAAGSSIHCLDQNGRPVPNFPFHLPDSVEIAHLALLSFSHSQEPRLLIGDQGGNLFMFDMAGNLQPGWGPKKLEAALAATPQLYQVNGRDVLLVMQQNGYVYAFNSRGEPYPGFPFNLDEPLQQAAFGSAGTSLRSTQLTVLSTTGVKVSFNLAGQVLNRVQLPANRSDARFELLAEPEGKSYILSRQERGKTSLYNESGKLLLEKNFITSSPRLVQYFDFGPFNRVYVLTETGPAKTYLYNYQAQLIGNKPIDNRLPVAMQYNPRSERYSLYNLAGKTLRRIVFQDK
ncbi:MAG: hypothetical protein ACO1NZ_16055 [Adhaeribacter sp.]